MQPENAIEVRDLTKKFKVYMDKGSQLKERVLFRKGLQVSKNALGVKRNQFQRTKEGGRSDRTQRMRQEYDVKAADKDHLPR